MLKIFSSGKAYVGKIGSKSMVIEICRGFLMTLRSASGSLLLDSYMAIRKLTTHPKVRFSCRIYRYANMHTYIYIYVHLCMYIYIYLYLYIYSPSRPNFA